MEREGRTPATARERALRRRARIALLALALLPSLAVALAAVAERALAAEPGRGPPYAILGVTALAAAGGALGAALLARRVAARLAGLERRAAREREAFEAASLTSSLAGGAWLSRLQEEEQRASERHALFRAENEELERFTYAVSHDLRAPLRHLDAFVTLFRRRNAAMVDARSARDLDAIGRAAERMGALVDGLLSFLQMRRRELVRAPVDVGALVRELVRELAPRVAGREIAWRIGELPPVSADAQLLRRALAELLSNAVKFTRTHPRAAIEIGGGARPDGAVIFVRDDGVGFDPRYAGKLFGVFARLHHPDEFEGTGIGLATVRRIVERHGGEVWAEGEPGRGATFYLSLPRSVAAELPPTGA